MKTAPPSLVAWLQAETEFLLADLYTVTLADGTALRWTSAQQDVSVPQPGKPALAWAAGDVLVSGLRFKSAVGLDVDEQSVTLAYWPAGSARPSLVTLATGGTVPIARALQKGVFDNARLRWDRVVLPAWGAAPVGNGEALADGTVSDGRVVMNEGRISSADAVGRIAATIKVKSDLVLLDIQMPRNLWQTGCIHTLYDAGCGLSKAAHTVQGTVGAGATTSWVPWAGSAASIYGQGTITFGSGANIGVKATVDGSLATGLGLAYPLDQAPAEGDLFTVCQGCNKSYARCTQLANTQNFRAYPNVPDPTVAA